MSTPERAWSELPETWRACLSLAWEAHGLGTIPVGAILVNGDKQLAGSGMNGVYLEAREGRSLNQGLLAHAEVNALLGLDAGWRYESFRLYSSLEPCLMCIGASTIATLGGIEFAGVDPYGGATRVVGKPNPAIERLDFDIKGPLEGAFGTLAAGLHVEFFLRHNPNGQVITAYRDKEPKVARVGESLNEMDIHSLSRSGIGIETALESMWEAII